MLRRSVRPSLALIAVAALTAAGAAANGNESDSRGDAVAKAAATDGIVAKDGQPEPGANAGPPYTFITELMGEPGTAIPLKNIGMLTRTKLGYRFRTGQQDSNTTVTLVSGGIRFEDTGTQKLTKVSSSCTKKKVKVGVAAVCRIPDGISERLPLLIEIWPRLGDDYTDTSSLPATYAVTVLGDKGNDTAKFGAGPDFFNGYLGRDRVWGGGGNDWVRAGIGNDLVVAGSGNDDIVAVEGRDKIHGGSGNDRLWAGDGDDRLWSGDGNDFVLCGNGTDRARAKPSDRVLRDCEAVAQR